MLCVCVCVRERERMCVCVCEWVCDFNFRNQFPECHETQNEHSATGGNASANRAQFYIISNNTKDPYMQTREVERGRSLIRTMYISKACQ
jgi:hypothetical protein